MKTISSVEMMCATASTKDCPLPTVVFAREAASELAICPTMVAFAASSAAGVANLTTRHATAMQITVQMLFAFLLSVIFFFLNMEVEQRSTSIFL